MWFPSPSLGGGFGEEFTGTPEFLGIAAPCATKRGLILQGTVTLGARRKDARRDTFSLLFFLASDVKCFAPSGPLDLVGTALAERSMPCPMKYQPWENPEKTTFKRQLKRLTRLQIRS